MRDVRHVPAALSDLSRDARRSGVAARPDLAGAGAGRRPSAEFGPARSPSRPLLELPRLRSRMPVGRAVTRDQRRRARRARAAAPVRDISEFIAANWPAARRPAPLPQRVAVHDPCTLTHVMHKARTPYTLLAHIPGIELL